MADYFDRHQRRGVFLDTRFALVLCTDRGLGGIILLASSVPLEAEIMIFIMDISSGSNKRH